MKLVWSCPSSTVSGIRASGRTDRVERRSLHLPAYRLLLANCRVAPWVADQRGIHAVHLLCPIRGQALLVGNALCRPKNQDPGEPTWARACRVHRVKQALPEGSVCPGIES